MKDWKVLGQVKDATTTEEMRAELYRLRHFDPLVRAVFDAADYAGMSAEDRYTMLAYHAMRDRNKVMETALEFANCTMRPIAVHSDAALKNGEAAALESATMQQTEK